MIASLTGKKDAAFLVPLLLISSATLAFITTVHAADLTWNNGAATGNWNSIDANWTGFTWNNATPDNAIFTTTTGTIQLTENISAGSFTFGLTNSNTSGTFAGSALAISGSLVAQADGNNYVAINPSLAFSNHVTVTGDVQLGRRNLEISGGAFTANRLVSHASWGRLLVSGGSVTMTNGIDDSILPAGNTMSVVLQSGSLHTPYIKTTNNWGMPDGDGVYLNGGKLFATANSSDFIQNYAFAGNKNEVAVGTGGAKINNNGFNITITKSMKNSGCAGQLTKSGDGKLTLTAINSYSGPTTVHSGTLSLGNGTSNTNLSDSAAVIVASGATLYLNYSGTDTVNALSFSGIARLPGIYSSANSPFITGSGTLTVLTGPATDYAGWAEFHGITGGQTGDDDHDGLNNFDEYAFGLDQRNGASAQPITSMPNPNTGNFTYTRRRTLLSGLAHTVWYSTNLTTWTRDTGATEGIPTANGEV